MRCAAISSQKGPKLSSLVKPSGLSWPSQVLLASCSAKAAANAAGPPSKLNQGPRQQRQMFAACSFPPSNSHCFVTGELSLFAAQMSGVAAMAPHCASNTATSRPQVVHIPAIHPPTGGPAAATPINTCPTSKRLFLTVCESDLTERVRRGELRSKFKKTSPSECSSSSSSSSIGNVQVEAQGRGQGLQLVQVQLSSSAMNLNTHPYRWPIGGQPLVSVIL